MSSILEFLTHVAGVSTSRAAVRAAWHSACAAGADHEAWWLKLTEAGARIGLRLTSVRLSVREVLGLARGESPLVAACADKLSSMENLGNEPTCVAVAGSRGHRAWLASIEWGGRGRWIRAAELAEMVGASDIDQPVVWVVADVAEPAAGMGTSGQDHHHSGAAHETLSPLQRLLGLLSPESHDIGLLTTYSVAVGFLALATPLAVEALVTTIAFGTLVQPLVVLAMILFSCLTLAGALRAMQAYVGEVIERRLFVRVAIDLAERLPRAKMEFHDGQDGPECINRFFEIVTVQKAVSSLLLEAVLVLLSAIISLVILAFYHPYMLAFDVLLIIALCFIVFVLGRGGVRTAIEESRSKYAMAAWLEEMMRLPLAFKLYGAPRFARERAEEIAVEYLARRSAHFRIVMRQTLAALLLQAVASTIVLALGGWLVMDGQMTLGQLVATELMVTIVVGSFAKLGKHIQTWCDLLAGCEKLGHLVDIPLEPSGGESRGDGTPPAALRAHQLGFSWHEGHALLEGFDLSIHPGERIAILGPHGSGKSTLVELLGGLREPHHGRIEFDGFDLRDVRREVVREQMAMIREVEIIEGSVLQNVRFGRDEVTLTDVRWALEAAGLLDDVMALPLGLQTPMRRDGAPLGSSQALRLMVARAIVGGPRLVFVDESLDSLDAKSLSIVLDTLCDRRAPWTLVLATRRPEVAASCDRVVDFSHSGRPHFVPSRLAGPNGSPKSLTDARNNDDAPH